MLILFKEMTMLIFQRNRVGPGEWVLKASTERSILCVFFVDFENQDVHTLTKLWFGMDKNNKHQLTLLSVVFPWRSNDKLISELFAWMHKLFATNSTMRHSQRDGVKNDNVVFAYEYASVCPKFIHTRKKCLHRFSNFHPIVIVRVNNMTIPSGRKKWFTRISLWPKLFFKW